MWLINTHNGIKGKLDRIYIEEYPAVKKHLDEYKDKIYKRSDQGDTPYNLRNCAYMEDFDKPKIIYMEIQTDNEKNGYPFPCFSYDDKNCIILNTGYIMTSTKEGRIEYVLGILNSKLGKFITKLYVTRLQKKQFRMLAQYVNNFPIPRYNNSYITTLVNTNLIKQTAQVENKIDLEVFKLYELTEEEINYVLNS